MKKYSEDCSDYCKNGACTKHAESHESLETANGSLLHSTGLGN